MSVEREVRNYELTFDAGRLETRLAPLIRHLFSERHGKSRHFVAIVKQRRNKNFRLDILLVPVNEPINFANPYFKIEQGNERIDLKAKKSPHWSTSQVQYATIVPDPQG
jgi:hypothetical protein